MYILVRALEEHPGLSGLLSAENCGPASTKKESEKVKL